MIESPLTLPCGAVLKNRLAKSAMSENMASSHLADDKFARVYRLWAEGGAGLIITGNIMVDRTALGEPHNVVLDQRREGFAQLQRWAEAGKANGAQIWAQLNHPGKQSPRFLSAEPVAPSAVAFPAPLNRVFAKPRELTPAQIQTIISAFGEAAAIARDAGFCGVQIHGAHGYLVSQFLSARHNQRTDEWGGSLAKRMLFAVSVYKEIRARVGRGFPVGIKINSADFQKDGFTAEDSLAVMRELDRLGIDLLEISGGTYEKPAMMGAPIAESTRAREAYFGEFARLAKNAVKCPVLLTGGFRTRAGMEEALRAGEADVIGLARSVAIDPDFPNQLLRDPAAKSPVRRLTTGFKVLDKLIPLEIVWYTQQIHRMGAGLKPDPKLSPLALALRSIRDYGLRSLRRVRARE